MIVDNIGIQKRKSQNKILRCGAVRCGVARSADSFSTCVAVRLRTPNAVCGSSKTFAVPRGPKVLQRAVLLPDPNGLGT